MKKSFIALFLMFVSVVSMAETSQGENFASTSNDDNIARAEAGGDIVASAPAGGDIVAYGSADGYQWTLDANGNFVISGEEGHYAVLSSEPWKNYRNEIKTIKFEGRFAFHGSCYRKFADLPNVVSIDMGSYINNTMVTNMGYMYADCPNLVTLDLSGFWDTSFVGDMSYMFYGCSKLLTVNVSSFDTSNVVDMSHMFEYCYNLVFVDITNFNIPKCQSLVQMFSNCRSLTEIDLSGMHCSGHIDASYMFEFCEKLKRVDVTDFFTESGNFYNMFAYYYPDMIICDSEWPASISSYTRENLRRSKIYVPQGLIYRYYDSRWGYDNIYENTIVTRYGDDDRRATLDITGRLLIRGNIDFSYYSIKRLFPDHLSEIKTVKFKRYNEYTTVYVNDFSFVFRDLNNLETVYWGDFVVRDNEAFRLNGMFLNCSSLICVNMPLFDTSLSIGNLSLERMFAGCSNLIAVNMSNLGRKPITNTSRMFDGCSNLIEVNMSYLQADNVYDMSRMFANCSRLASIDLSDFKAGQVENVSEMFSGCSSLTSLVLPGMTFGYNADNVFTECSLLKNIILNHNNDIPEEYVSYVVYDYKRFFASIPAIHNCTLSLPPNNLLPLSNTGDWKYVNSIGNLGYGDNLDCFWDIDKYGNLLIWPKNGVEGWIYRPSWEAYVANINTVRFAGIVHADNCCEMFKWLNQLTSIDLSCFDSSNVTDMREMFYGCSRLTSLNLSNFDTSNVTDMDRMFYGCSRLTSLDLSNFDTSNVTGMDRMFYGCSSLKSLEFSNFTNLNISGNPYYIFGLCDNLKDITVYAVTPPSMKRSTFDYLSSCTLHVPAESLLLYTCADEWKNLYSICSIDNIEHGKNGDCYWDIDKDGNLLVWPRNGVEGQISNDATWNSLQDCCKYIKTGRFAGTVYAPVDCSGLFAECNSLSSLDLSNLNTRYVANMSHMFENCRSLSSIDFSNFDTNHVTDMSYMFNSCESLSELDLSNFDTRNVEKMDNIFRDCSSLDYLTLDRFFIPDGASNIFYHTNPRETVLKSIPYIGSADLRRLETKVILDLSDASYIHEGPNDFPSVIKATYTRSVTNKWGTIVLPFNVRMVDTYDFYQVNSIKNDNLNLKRIPALPAGTPAIFCVNDGETKLTCTLSYGMLFHINTNLNPVPAGDLTLVGTFSQLDLTEEEGFIIANDKFWNIQDIRGENRVGIKPFRAYLAGSLSSGAHSLGISFDDTEDVDAVDAISDVENGEMEYYDLNGRRLNRLQNGVNIVKLGNGKTRKIFVE